MKPETQRTRYKPSVNSKQPLESVVLGGSSISSENQRYPGKVSCTTLQRSSTERLKVVPIIKIRKR